VAFCLSHCRTKILPLEKAGFRKIPLIPDYSEKSSRLRIDAAASTNFAISWQAPRTGALTPIGAGEED
jgi:hypothetical protein